MSRRALAGALGTAPAMVAAAALVAGGCGGETTGPSGPVPPAPAAGTLTVVLATPRTDDGALMLVVTGGPVHAVAAAPELAGAAVYQAALDSMRTRVILTGPLAAGPVATLQVPDVGRWTRYRLTLEQVASSVSLQPQPLAGYRLSVVAR
ncbi:MAG TPA: hypothetical protein VFS40_13340 [Gemmatimonadales bacterium]|nr:hypothetical protein [Gemmatimonadales bacterium]